MQEQGCRLLEVSQGCTRSFSPSLVSSSTLALHLKPKSRPGPHLFVLKAAVLAQHIGQEVHEAAVLLQLMCKSEGGKSEA